MNFSFYLFGTPSGYNQYPADTNDILFQDFFQKQKTDTQLTVYRKGQLVYYAYNRMLTSGSTSQYLGICLIFNGVYSRNSKQLFYLFDKAYNDIAISGKILQLDRSGKISFATDKFANEPQELDRIQLFFKNNIDNNFSKDFAAVSSSFKIGNGTKILSINDPNNDILAAIGQFDCVHISNNEKSDSELDRIHKMLSALHTEKQDLDTKYRKLLGQKKQYKIVILLCIVVIGCIIGLIVFNSSLQSKDSKIQSMVAELNEKNKTITNQSSNISELQIAQTNLNIEIDKLTDDIKNKNSIIKESAEKIKSLSSENNSLMYDITDLKNKNRKLTSETSNGKNTDAPKYKVIAYIAPCYKQCTGEYAKIDCYYSSGDIVNVYTQRDGYGLTISGYIKMSDLQKY